MVEELVNISFAERKVEEFRKRLQPHYEAINNAKDAHLWMACLASFPIAVNIHLMYQLWANFKRLTDKKGNIIELPVLTVSDCILSPLFQLTGKDLYEMNADIRAYLMGKIETEFGKELIGELASFLYKYSIHFKEGNVWKNFYDAQEWMAILAVDPEKAAVNILESLKKNLEENNTFQSIGIANLIAALVKENKEFASLIQDTVQKKDKPGINTPQPQPPTDTLIDGQSFKNRSIVLRMDKSYPANRININLPVAVSSRLQPVHDAEQIEPANKQVEKEETGKAYALIVGINNYKLSISGLKGPVIDAEKIRHALIDKEIVSEEDTTLLLDENATTESFRKSFSELLRKAQKEDHVIVYFSGHASNDQSGNKLVFHNYDSPDTADIGVITDHQFRDLIKIAAINDPNIVFILDSHSGGRNWLDETNPRHVALMATHLDQTCLDEVKEGGAMLTYTLVSALRRSRNITYRELYQFVMQEHINESRLGDTEQTPLFLVHKDRWDAFIFTRNIKSTARIIQEQLYQMDYNVQPDGEYGDTTKLALDQFKKQYDIPDDANIISALRTASMLRFEPKLKVCCLFMNTSNDFFYVEKIWKTIEANNVDVRIEPAAGIIYKKQITR